MSFFSILFALMLEQARPLVPNNLVYRLLEQWSAWVVRTLDTGVRQQAWVAWGLAIFAPAMAALLIHIGFVSTIGWLAAAAWNVVLLYLTLGFRQFSHHFTEIREALDDGSEDKARTLLAQWQQVQVGDIPRSEVVRHVIEYSVVAAHRHVFGVFFWYAALSVVGLGPVGAVAYRLAEHVHRRWLREASHEGEISSVLIEVAQRAWQMLDWLPARATALGFAIVGSFEDAMDGWRHHAQNFPQDNDGVILAATAGAIGVRLGGAPLAVHPDHIDHHEKSEHHTPGKSTPGNPTQVAHLASVVGLVWRSVIMWLVLVALLTMANLMG